MKKNFPLIFSALGLLCAVSVNSNAYADEWSTKACRLTIIDQSTTTMECIGSGMMCSSIFDCFGIFDAEIG